MEEKIEILNNIYMSLGENASRLASTLNAAGYECGWDWRENPTENGRNYPLPVINVYSLCTLVVDVDVVVLDMTVNRKKLLGMNIKKAAEKRRLEIYAFDRSTTYNVLDYDGDAEKVIPTVFSISYENFRIRFRLDKNTDAADIRAIIAEFSDKRM